MTRLPITSQLTLLGILVGQAVSGDANTGHLEGSASEASNSMLASPDGPNVFDFHVGGWPFDVEFPEPSFLPGYGMIYEFINLSTFVFFQVNFGPDWTQE